MQIHDSPQHHLRFGPCSLPLETQIILFSDVPRHWGTFIKPSLHNKLQLLAVTFFHSQSSRWRLFYVSTNSIVTVMWKLYFCVCTNFMVRKRQYASQFGTEIVCSISKTASVSGGLPLAPPIGHYCSLYIICYCKICKWRFSLDYRRNHIY